MSSSDAVSDTSESERAPGIPNAVTSAMEALAPSVARGFGSGNFAIVAGGVSLFRAIRSFRKGDRKRALLRAVVGLFWVGVVLAQRRRKSGSAGPSPAEVADTSPDVADAVEPGGRDADHATGEEVVDTTDADLDESDLDESDDAADAEASAAGEREDAGVDQRDVVDTTDVEDAADADEGSVGESSEEGVGESSAEDAGETAGTDES